MAATMEDVARHAGVCTATVSRVVNRKHNVAPATRDRVLAAVREVGYVASSAPAARAATGSIGVLVPDLINPVFPAFAHAIETRLSAAGRYAVVCTVGTSGPREQEYISILLQRGADGIIFVGTGMTDTTCPNRPYHDLRRLGMPMAFVNGRVPGLPVPTVATDEQEAARIAVDHLVSLGHERLALVVGPLHYQPAIDKRAGFLAAVRAAGLPEGRVAIRDWGVEGGRAATEMLLGRPDPPTGVLCGSDLMAIGAIEAVRDADLDVPRDVSVVGYDNTPLARHTGPPLTTVSQQIDRMAEVVVSLLLDAITGTAGDGGRSVDYQFRPELVVRASTARPPRAGRLRRLPGGQ